jgi:peptidoglycan-N-acetylglucosamine deacetylase
MKHSLVVTVLVVFYSGCASSPRPDPLPPSELPIRKDFHWPEGKKAAISLTYDDAYTDQVDYLIPLLERYSIRGTFYVLDINLVKRLEAWQAAAARGHEIGNHSSTHPCTINYELGSLEDLTLDQMARDIDAATINLRTKVGVEPVTFAYPCGLKTVGRGRGCRSYVPIVAPRFLVGRGYLEETPNRPGYCDLANVNGTKIDSLPFATLKNLVDQAAAKGQWICFAGHGVGPPGSPSHQVLEQLCQYLKEPDKGFWVDTVANVGRYIKSQREAK